MKNSSRLLVRKKILLKNQEMNYILRQAPRARRMRLTVSCADTFMLTMPVNAPLGLAERFIWAKAGWLIEKLKYFERFKNRPYLLAGTRQQYLKYKETARRLALARLEYFNQFYGFKYNCVSIKNQKTRWGSCSAHGNLNFSYKIALLSQPAADYIIVHELCHLAEMNHSKNFWRLVGHTIPNYLEIIKEIKSN